MRLGREATRPVASSGQQAAGEEVSLGNAVARGGLNRQMVTEMLELERDKQKPEQGKGAGTAKDTPLEAWIRANVADCQHASSSVRMGSRRGTRVGTRPMCARARAHPG